MKFQLSSHYDNLVLMAFLAISAALQVLASETEYAAVALIAGLAVRTLLNSILRSVGADATLTIAAQQISATTTPTVTTLTPEEQELSAALNTFVQKSVTKVTTPSAGAASAGSAAKN